MVSDHLSGHHGANRTLCVLKMPLPRPLICVVLLYVHYCPPHCPSCPYLCWPVPIPKRIHNLGLQDKTRDRLIQPPRKLPPAAQQVLTRVDIPVDRSRAHHATSVYKPIVHRGTKVVGTWAHALLLFFDLECVPGEQDSRVLKAHFVSLPNLCQSQGLKSCENGPQTDNPWNLQPFLNNRAAGTSQIQHPANGASDPAPARMHTAPHRKLKKKPRGAGQG